jgi:hypothetical protein
MNARGHVIATTSAIAVTTAAAVLLGMAFAHSQSGGFEGPPFGTTGLALMIPFVGAAAARAIFRFGDGRTVVSTLVALGSIVGAAIGIATCPWSTPLQTMPLGVAWIAAWSLVGAVGPACQRVEIPSGRMRIARAIVSFLAFLLLPVLIGWLIS